MVLFLSKSLGGGSLGGLKEKQPVGIESAGGTSGRETLNEAIWQGVEAPVNKGLKLLLLFPGRVLLHNESCEATPLESENGPNNSAP